jgi:CrcB protein
MVMIKTYLAVMAGGALGAASRMWLSSYVTGRFGETFPIGTMAVNVLGSLIIGLFVGMTGTDSPREVPPIVRQFVIFGFLGGFTTFSSFSLQTFNLINDGEWLYAGVNIVLSIVICLLAVWLGFMLATLVTPK